MGKHRLNGLPLLDIHLEIIIKPEEEVDMYANKHKRYAVEALVLCSEESYIF